MENAYAVKQQEYKLKKKECLLKVRLKFAVKSHDAGKVRPRVTFNIVRISLILFLPYNTAKPCSKLVRAQLSVSDLTKNIM